MRKLYILAATAAVGLLGCSDPNSEWLNKGYAVGLDRKGWAEADQATQLGTAGHWLLSLQKQGFLSSSTITDDEHLRSNAVTLMSCIDLAIPTSSLAMNTLVAECIKVNGWMKTN